MVNHKKFYLGIILFFVLVLSGCSAFQTRNLGVMNMERVLNESKRAGELQQELLEIGNKLEEQYNQQENQEEDAEENDQEELDQLYGEYLENKQRLETDFNKEITSILEEISREKKLDVVLHQDGVYYGGIDITDEVIKILDERYTKGGEEAGEGE